MANQQWKILTIKDICEAIFDGPHATPKKIDEGPIYLNIGNLINGRIDLSSTNHVSEEDFKLWTKRVVPRKDDLVFSYETRLGEAALIPEGLHCCLGRRMGLIRPDLEKVHPKFLLYSYLSTEFQNTIKAHTINGSTIDSIRLTELPDFPIRIPPLEEQTKIADFLSLIDEKIELNQQMNQTLEEMARAIFKSWFVDFDPVHENVEAQKLGKPLPHPDFPAGFVDSELGPIPKGWSVRKLEAVATIVMGQSPKSESYNFEGFGTPLVNGPVEFGNRYTVKAKWTSAPKKLCQEGDLIFCVRGSTVGRRVIADGVYCLGRGVCSIRSKDDNQEFINELINTQIKELLTKATGSVFPNLNSKDIQSLKLILPSRHNLSCFKSIACLFSQKIWMNEKEIQTLSELRDTLLPKLISGQIRLNQKDVAGA